MGSHLNAELALASIASSCVQASNSLISSMLEQFSDLFKSGKLDMETMVDIALKESKDLATKIMAEYTQAAELKEKQSTASCPSCKGRCQTRGMRKRTVQTRCGSFELDRPYFYCNRCNAGFFPLDTILKLDSNKHQFDLSRVAINFSAEVPYEVASNLFEMATGEKFSAHAMHELTNEVANEASLENVIPSAKIIEDIISDNSTGHRRPVLVVSADGAMEPIRAASSGRKKKRGPGCWKEAKGFRLYLLGSDQRITQIAGWHQVCNEEEFGKSLEFVAKLVPQDKVRIALIADGAEWIWKHFRNCFPEGREILDYYHASEKVYEVANAQYGKDTPKANEWWEATMARLSEGEVSSVIKGLAIMSPASEEAEKIITGFKGYIQKREDQFGYSQLKRSGMPRGSGGIESANKYVCHVRLKRSGAWWYSENANNMLKLRCARINNTLNNVFDSYKRKKCLDNIFCQENDMLDVSITSNPNTVTANF